MTAAIARSFERSQINLIKLSAPTLKPEPLYVPLRPPILRATATIAEILTAKGATIQ